MIRGGLIRPKGGGVCRIPPHPHGGGVYGIPPLSKSEKQQNAEGGN